MSLSLFVPSFHGFPGENISFVEVPKAGSSTTLLTLINAHAMKHGLAAVTVPRQPEGKSRTIGFRSKERPPFCEIIRDRYLFSMVRNPFARVLSAYLDKVKHRNDIYLSFARYVGIDLAKDISFTEFLTHLAAMRGRVLNRHWAPQTGVIQARALRYDFVGALETIGDDLGLILRNCGFSDSHIQSFIPHARKSGSKIADFYDDTATDLVREIYRDDFRLLGYSLDPKDALSDPGVRAQQIGGGRVLSEAYAGLFAAREHAHWHQPEAAAEELRKWLPMATAMKLAAWDDHLFAAGVFARCRDFTTAKQQYEACLDLEPQAAKASLDLENLNEKSKRFMKSALRKVEGQAPRPRAPGAPDAETRALRAARRARRQQLNPVE